MNCASLTEAAMTSVAASYAAISTWRTCSVRVLGGVAAFCESNTALFSDEKDVSMR